MTTDTNSTNPYEASNIDEKPAEIVRFFKGEPVPQKIVGIVLWDAMHYAYSSDKRPYFAIGVLQALYLALVGLAVFAFVAHPQMAIAIPWLVGFVGGSLFVLWVLLYVISIKAIFRILRKERMVFAPSIREIWQLFHSLINGILFLLTFLGSFAFALILILPGLYLTDLSGFGTNTPRLILGICFYVLGTGLWIAFVCIFYMRSALAIHCIIDQNVNFLTAYRRAWALTRGNLRTLAFGTPGTSKPLTTFLILVVTCGLGLLPIIGYYFCWLTVAYLMLSGQCETVAQQPDEW